MDSMLLEKVVFITQVDSDMRSGRQGNRARMLSTCNDASSPVLHTNALARKGHTDDGDSTDHITWRCHSSLSLCKFNLGCTHISSPNNTFLRMPLSSSSA
jgi:hypothetical protein